MCSPFSILSPKGIRLPETKTTTFRHQRADVPAVPDLLTLLTGNMDLAVRTMLLMGNQ